MSKYAEYRHVPVVVKLYENEVNKADLLRELKIDRHQIDRELLRQPGRFAWWASLHSEIAAKVEMLEIELDQLYAKLYVHYNKTDKLRVTEVKHLIELNSEYKHLRHKLWEWRKSERFLKSAVRAFDQRLYALQSGAADIRKEKIQA